jgi:hypothetical protein
MKYSFVFAVILAILVSMPFTSYGQEAAPPPELSRCKSQRGAVLVTPETPHTTVQAFCADELRNFDCQILSHIRNYIIFSYGRCENNDDMYAQIFSRPACSALKGKELSDFNRKVYEAIPDEAWRFVRIIRRIEFEKGCYRYDIIVE